jgi:hypothetical protein
MINDVLTKVKKSTAYRMKPYNHLMGWQFDSGNDEFINIECTLAMGAMNAIGSQRHGMHLYLYPPGEKCTWGVLASNLEQV